MKNKNVTRIARISGKSKATVSRVLNHCPGVENSVREEILRVASMEAEKNAEEEIRLSIILPDNPKYFWQDALQQAAEPTPYRKQVSVYTDTLHGNVLNSYMDQIEENSTAALIFAGIPDERLKERLTNYSLHHLLIQICEYTPVRNSFYVGSDFYRDGYHLGKMLVEQEKGKECHVAVLRQECYSSDERNRGFADALRGSGIGIAYLNEPQDLALYSSYLAREIASSDQPITHLFCPSIQTAQACDALRKIKDRKIGYLGFENPPRAKEYLEKGVIRALAIQNVSEQIRTALKLAEDYLRTRTYPDRKYTYIPSVFLNGTGCTEDDRGDSL